VKTETLDQKKARRAVVARGKVRDRRRFKLTPVPLGEGGVEASPNATGTIFPSRVFEVGDESVLKDGAHNSKIGGDVLVGRLKGAKIFTLTLEERATCPRTCEVWTSCYGNSMPHSRRWKHGETFEKRLVQEVSALCAQHEKVLIRLHILGDFYSTGYVSVWDWLLHAHPNLYVFGFTAHTLHARGNLSNEPARIALALSRTRQRMPDRFCIRESGYCGPWGSFVIDFPTEMPRLGTAVVCPEQRTAMNGEGKADHCGNCGLCWAGDTPIVFVKH
jgi:hypothetical protein